MSNPSNSFADDFPTLQFWQGRGERWGILASCRRVALADESLRENYTTVNQFRLRLLAPGLDLGRGPLALLSPGPEQNRIIMVTRETFATQCLCAAFCWLEILRYE